MSKVPFWTRRCSKPVEGNHSIVASLILSRAVDELITAVEAGGEIDAAKYAALLMHPASEIRRQAGNPSERNPLNKSVPFRNLNVRIR